MITSIKTSTKDVTQQSITIKDAITMSIRTIGIT